MSETQVWVEPIEGYPGFYRLCVESGDCQSRAVLNDVLLRSLVASAHEARELSGFVRGRGNGVNTRSR